MSQQAQQHKDRQFLAVIGDEVCPVIPQRLQEHRCAAKANPAQDSVTGLLLAGVGHVTNPPDSQKNFLVVDAKTEISAIEEAFDSFTSKRKDIAILLINQHVRLC